MAEPEEIIARRPSHPVTTTMLIVAALALGGNIYLAIDQLGYYYNRDTLTAIKQGIDKPDKKGKHYRNQFDDPTWENVRKDLKIADDGSDAGGSAPPPPPSGGGTPPPAGGGENGGGEGGGEGGGTEEGGGGTEEGGGGTEEGGGGTEEGGGDGE